MTHVPFKGSPRALTDVASGQIQPTTPTLPAAMGMVTSGRVRALAVTGRKRSSAMPEVPTAVEADLPGYEAEFWVAVLAPARTPRPVVARLVSEIALALQDAGVQAGLARQGMEPAPSSPEQLLDVTTREGRKWAQLIEEANIRVDH